MQGFLVARGDFLSGMVQDLDEGDPELSADPAMVLSAVLKTLASTRYFTGYRSTQKRWEQKVLVRTGEQPVDGALVPRSNAPNEAIVSTIKTLHVELLLRLDPVQLQEFGRQDNLAFGRDGSLHRSKILSYLGWRKDS